MTLDLKQLEEHLLIGSTLVEGSTLTESEARAVLDGKTISGHPASEARELTCYRLATEWLLEQVTQVPFLSLDLVLGFHARLTAGSPDAGRFKTHANYTFRMDGSRHDYLAPHLVGDALLDWVGRFNQESAFEAAVRLYADFQQIHPFRDGNGRVGRILTAYWLHWKHGLLFRFYAKDKRDHLRAIEASDHGDLSLLVEFFRSRVSSP